MSQVAFFKEDVLAGMRYQTIRIDISGGFQYIAVR